MFDTFNKTQLKKIIRYYNLNQMIRNYSKMTEDELRIALKKVVHIDEDYNIYLHPRGTDNLLSGSETKTLIKYRDPNAPKKKRGKKNEIIDDYMEQMNEYEKMNNSFIIDPTKAPEAPYNPFISTLEDQLVEFYKLSLETNEENYKYLINEYEKELKYLENRKLKSSKSIEQNNDKISNAKIMLNMNRERLAAVPKVLKKIERFKKEFEIKFNIDFDEFLETIQMLDNYFQLGDRISFYDNYKLQPFFNELYRKFDEEKFKKQLAIEKKISPLVDNIESEYAPIFLEMLKKYLEDNDGYMDENEIENESFRLETIAREKEKELGQKIGKMRLIEIFNNHQKAAAIKYQKQIEASSKASKQKALDLLKEIENKKEWSQLSTKDKY